MRVIRVLAVTTLLAASLYGQRPTRQDYCFNNPTSPVCPGHDMAIKPIACSCAVACLRYTLLVAGRGARRQRAGDLRRRHRLALRRPQCRSRHGLQLLGDGELAAYAHDDLSQLVAQKGFSDADVQKILDRLADAEQVGISLHNNKVVVMLTGPVAEQALTVPEPGLKTVPLNNGTILMGHADAVDWAVQRVNWKGQLSPLLQSGVEQRQASAELWVIGGPAAGGPAAVRAGIRQIALTVWVRDPPHVRYVAVESGALHRRPRCFTAASPQLPSKATRRTCDSPWTRTTCSRSFRRS